ncbi:hypothetical protein B0H14DRAFT_3426261 [Mycena olivaceomarginata]|nr:hypothetical protein B0H14DRAFT_3426261 [Mycena olivaceomarginata]
MATRRARAGLSTGGSAAHVVACPLPHRKMCITCLPQLARRWEYIPSQNVKISSTRHPTPAACAGGGQAESDAGVAVQIAGD